MRISRTVVVLGSYKFLVQSKAESLFFILSATFMGLFRSYLADSQGSILNLKKVHIFSRSSYILRNWSQVGGSTLKEGGLGVETNRPLQGQFPYVLIFPPIPLKKFRPPSAAGDFL